MIWSNRRRWLGNLVPLLPSALVAVSGIWLGVWGVALGALVAIPLISRFGFYENSQIRSELLGLYPEGGILVGFVYDRPADLLDAHAEVGFMNIVHGELTIRTETREIKVPLGPDTTLSRQFNLHQLIGLGGWIRIENQGLSPLLIESREANTMFASKKRTKQLFERMKHEKGGSEEPPFSNQLA